MYFAVSGKHSPGVYCASGVMKGSWRSKGTVAAQGAHCWSRARPMNRQVQDRGMWNVTEAQFQGPVMPLVCHGQRRQEEEGGRREEEEREEWKILNRREKREKAKYKWEVQRKYLILRYSLCWVKFSDWLSHLISPRSLEKAQNERRRGRDGKQGPQCRRERSWGELGAPCGLLAILEPVPPCWGQTSAVLVRNQRGPFKTSPTSKKGLNHFKEVWTTQTKSHRSL